MRRRQCAWSMLTKVMRFHKYQALGNDYLVLETDGERALIPSLVRRICNRHYGVGSDGILLESAPGPGARFGLRILNPDGSEAEKIGNAANIESNRSCAPP